MTDKELLDKLQDPQSRLEILLYLIYESLGSSGGGGGTGTKDYSALDNKPSINGTTLQETLHLKILARQVMVHAIVMILIASQSLLADYKITIFIFFTGGAYYGH